MTSDGANLLDPGNQGTQTANINQNQVAEVSVLTSAYDASFAKGPVTLQAYGKSGSAQFHGQAYLYARNGVFNAIDSYDKSQGLKPISDSYWYPGGDFGGPVLIPGSKFNRNRDKLFFYGAFEYMKQTARGHLVPILPADFPDAAGNFSPAYLASLGRLRQCAIQRRRGSVHQRHQHRQRLRQPHQHRGRHDSAEPDRSEFGSLPQDVSGAQRGSDRQRDGQQLLYFLGPPVNRWELRLRGDYNISDKTKLYFSWNHQHEIDQSPFYVWWWGSPSTLPYPSPQTANQLANVYSANLVHVFSPTLTNEFVFADAIFDNPVVLTNPSR
jgi:hypothetical protein